MAQEVSSGRMASFQVDRLASVGKGSSSIVVYSLRNCFPGVANTLGTGARCEDHELTSLVAQRNRRSAPEATEHSAFQPNLSVECAGRRRE